MTQRERRTYNRMIQTHERRWKRRAPEGWRWGILCLGLALLTLIGAFVTGQLIDVDTSQMSARQSTIITMFTIGWGLTTILSLACFAASLGRYDQ